MKKTKTLPQNERCGLTSQIRRPDMSIPSNIAEGYGRKATPDCLKPLYIANGSMYELEMQILLSGYTDFLNKENLSELRKDIG
ncbi:MAG: four helix bundle protein [Desulfobacterales bacterium]|nr:four helix bundle protein [Desulfobacterales bacterium]